jgi:hypothetical protein
MFYTIGKCGLLPKTLDAPILKIEEGSMPQAQTMTLDEKIAIGLKAIEFRKAGNEDEYERLMKSMPMPPYLAEVAKELMCADFLIDGGWNLAEADAEYGPGWISVKSCFPLKA